MKGDYHQQLLEYFLIDCAEEPQRTESHESKNLSTKRTSSSLNNQKPHPEMVRKVNSREPSPSSISIVDPSFHSEFGEVHVHFQQNGQQNPHADREADDDDEQLKEERKNNKDPVARMDVNDDGHGEEEHGPQKSSVSPPPKSANVVRFHVDPPEVVATMPRDDDTYSDTRDTLSKTSLTVSSYTGGAFQDSSELDTTFESRAVPAMVRVLDRSCAWIEGATCGFRSPSLLDQSYGMAHLPRSSIRKQRPSLAINTARRVIFRKSNQDHQNLETQHENYAAASSRKIQIVRSTTPSTGGEEGDQVEEFAVAHGKVSTDDNEVKDTETENNYLGAQSSARVDRGGRSVTSSVVTEKVNPSRRPADYSSICESYEQLDSMLQTEFTQQFDTSEKMDDEEDFPEEEKTNESPQVLTCSQNEVEAELQESKTLQSEGNAIKLRLGTKPYEDGTSDNPWTVFPTATLTTNLSKGSNESGLQTDSKHAANAYRVLTATDSSKHSSPVSGRNENELRSDSNHAANAYRLLTATDSSKSSFPVPENPNENGLQTVSNHAANEYRVLTATYSPESSFPVPEADEVRDDDQQPPEEYLQAIDLPTTPYVTLHNNGLRPGDEISANNQPENMFNAHSAFSRPKSPGTQTQASDTFQHSRSADLHHVKTDEERDNSLCSATSIHSRSLEQDQEEIGPATPMPFFSEESSACVFFEETAPNAILLGQTRSYVEPEAQMFLSPSLSAKRDTKVFDESLNPFKEHVTSDEAPTAAAGHSEDVFDNRVISIPSPEPVHMSKQEQIVPTEEYSPSHMEPQGDNKRDSRKGDAPASIDCDESENGNNCIFVPKAYSVIDLVDAVGDSEPEHRGFSRQISSKEDPPEHTFRAEKPTVIHEVICVEETSLPANGRNWVVRTASIGIYREDPPEDSPSSCREDGQESVIDRSIRTRSSIEPQGARISVHGKMNFGDVKECGSDADSHELDSRVIVRSSTWRGPEDQDMTARKISSHRRKQNNTKLPEIVVPKNKSPKRQQRQATHDSQRSLGNRTDVPVPVLGFRTSYRSLRERSPRRLREHVVPQRKYDGDDESPQKSGGSRSEQLLGLSSSNGMAHLFSPSADPQESTATPKDNLISPRVQTAMMDDDMNIKQATVETTSVGCASPPPRRISPRNPHRKVQTSHRLEEKKAAADSRFSPIRVVKAVKSTSRKPHIDLTSVGTNPKNKPDLIFLQNLSSVERAEQLILQAEQLKNQRQKKRGSRAKRHTAVEGGDAQKNEPASATVLI